MASDEGAFQVRSFRLCFELERRLHKIDRWRLPFPQGVPLRGIGHAAAILFLVWLVGELPLVGSLFGVLPFGLRYVVLPVGGAWLLGRWRIDGRSAAAVMLSWCRMRVSPRRLAGFRGRDANRTVRLDAVTVAPDERAARYRAGVVAGPAVVVLRYPASVHARGSELHVRQLPGAPLWRGRQVRLRTGQRVVVK